MLVRERTGVYFLDYTVLINKESSGPGIDIVKSGNLPVIVQNLGEIVFVFSHEIIDIINSLALAIGYG